MSRVIYGVTVGTTMSPERIRKKINPVTTINGIGADENGNVEIESGGVYFATNETLKLEDGILSVNTTNDMEQDNTLPITSAGVYAAVGNIEALLKTI